MTNSDVIVTAEFYSEYKLDQSKFIATSCCGSNVGTDGQQALQLNVLWTDGDIIQVNTQNGKKYTLEQNITIK